MSDGTHLTERQQVALTVASIVEGRSVASLRREAVSKAADELLADERIATVVRFVMRHRARHGIGRPALRAVDGSSK